jgi:hypothetical protein
MGVEIRKAVMKSGVTSPEVSPEGREGAVADRNFGDRAENRKTSGNVFPNMGVQAVCVPEIPGVIPAITTAEPIRPGGRGVRVELSEEFCQEGGVLRLDGEDAESPSSFGTQTSDQATLQLAFQFQLVYLSRAVQRKECLSLSRISYFRKDVRKSKVVNWQSYVCRFSVSTIVRQPKVYLLNVRSQYAFSERSKEGNQEIASRS